MNKSDKIYVAGSNGLVGSNIVKKLESAGYNNIIKSDVSDFDLTDAVATLEFFINNRPDYVFLAAAKVGGISANDTYPADFIRINLQIQINVIDAAYKTDVKKLLFLGSSCIYPKLAPQPIKEEYLLTGSLETTNDSYAIAKIAGINMIDSYNRQYGTKFISAMPTNLYGPGDNFDLKTSHVLPAMLRKFHEAKIEGKKNVTLWGSGTPKREFLFVEDLADALVFLMNNYKAAPRDVYLNVGVGEDVSIKELAHIIKDITGFEGEIEWDLSMPDGTPRKLLDVSRLNNIGWKAQTSLEDGIKKTYNWYLNK
ncbi:MAG: GDP-L-fucose synthase [Deltaproteobacteria bacterium]|nr:GDP-L-fucose synthase [Deltaproteobacteria bacterium]